MKVHFLFLKKKRRDKKKVAFAYKIHVCVYLNASNKRSKKIEKILFLLKLFLSEKPLKWTEPISGIESIFYYSKLITDVIDLKNPSKSWKFLQSAKVEGNCLSG